MKEITIRAVAYLAIAGGAFASGYYYGSGNEIEVTNTQLKTIEKIETKRVIVRETTPDGTQKETVTETETNDRQAVEHEKGRRPDDTIAKAKAEKLLRQRDYAASLQWGFGANDLLVPKEALIPMGASMGYRLLDQVWVEGGLMWEQPQMTLGVRVEF